LLGRAGLVLYIFFSKFKNEFEVAVLGLKGAVAIAGVAFATEISKTQTSQKPTKPPLGPREKLLGRAGLVLRKYFKHDFLVVKAGAFFNEMGLDLGHEANPKKPKSMKEPPDLTPRGGSELSSPR
jgi:hypothetical protein